MKYFFASLTGLMFLSISLLNAQIDQVSVGNSYSQQAYYKISTGEVTTMANESWDMAFSNLGDTDGGVFINESVSFMASGLELYFLFHFDWTEPIVLDTALLIEDNRLYNPELTWDEGAFNTIRNPDDPEDYGWGAYNPQSEIIEGVLIYILKMRDGSYKKINITSLTDGEYSFRYADLDGSNEVIRVVSKNDAGDDPLIYFSLATGETVDFPDDFDLIFQRYIDPLDDGSGGIIQYTVTGVLMGPGTEGVAVLGVDPDTIDEADYVDQYSSAPNTIGHVWKFFSFTTGWTVFEDQVYFVKTKEGDKYKILFYDFEGSSTGITTLEKTYLGTVSAVAEIHDESPVSVYPNPCSDILYLEQNHSTPLKLGIYDASGRPVYKGSLSEDHLSIPSTWNNGMYHLILENQDYRITKNVLIIK